MLNNKKICAEISVPGDKSIAHRALILGSIADGESEIIGLPDSADIKSTIACIRTLGIEISVGAFCTIYGKGMYGYTKPIAALDAGNSGTTMRLLAGILSAQNFSSVLTGDKSLCSRPMNRIIEPLRLMGAKIEGTNRGLAPLYITGAPLTGIRYELPVASAQLKSCLLFAGLYASGETEIIEREPTRSHSEIMLNEFGAIISGAIIAPHPLRPAKINIPGDISSAAYFLALGVLLPDCELHLPNIGINPGRTGILTYMKKMGASISVENRRISSGEPVADISVSTSLLKAVNVGANDVASLIDELPIVALLACFAEGTTIISDAGELRNKECDRISAITSELKKLGADIAEKPDGMIIHGGGRLTAARLSSHGDHRIAMTLAIASCLIDGGCEIEGKDCVKISYPGFFNELSKIGLYRAI